MDPVRATSDAQRTALGRGELPKTEEVRPGVHAIALDMPGMQPPYAFSYVVVEPAPSRAVHVIDAGLDTPENWSAFTRELAGLGGDVADVATVTLTHMHFDHTGLSNRIREASGATVRMHAVEAAAIRAGRQFAAGNDVAETLAAWGVPADWTARLSAVAESRADAGTAVLVDEELSDGARIDLGEYSATVIHTPGHTSGHICLTLDGQNAVFTGDHVLPVINPGVGLGGHLSADPLGEYYASLARLDEFAGAELLPGHGYRCAPLGARCAEIRAHHEARTECAREELRSNPELTVWELASRLRWTGGWENLPPVSRMSALGQTAMHAVRARAGADE